MSWREFIASLVDSLAWPAAVAIAVVVLRRQLGTLLEGSVKRLKAGPLEVEYWEKTAIAAAESVAIAAPASVQYDDEIQRLMTLADWMPNDAVIESFKLVENELDAIVKENDFVPPRNAPPGRLADELAGAGVITQESATAIRGLATLRDLAAHGGSDALAPATRAREYVAMTRAVMFSLRARRAA
jgi:hypothetical protein